jgi:hypothetical protein
VVAVGELLLCVAVVLGVVFILFLFPTDPKIARDGPVYYDDAQPRH